MKKIRYIDNDTEKGIDYDWKFLKKEYRKLKIPAKYYNPIKADWNRCGYVFAMSDRTHGKTTETLLLGMLMNWHYGTIIHYFRTSERSIRPYSLNQLFPVILDHGYVEKITEGRWNGVRYFGHRWYYVFRDEDGKIIDQAPQHFMICMHLGESDDRKSGYNCPTGDIIIFDEFIEIDGYGYSDFQHLSDLVSTVFRHRLCCCVYMLSNTIDVNSPWFDEFCIRDDVQIMHHGEARYIESELGTVSFVEILEPNKDETTLSFIKRYFGFNNPKLAAITGKGVWASDHFQHIPQWTDEEQEQVHVLLRRLYVQQSGKLLRLQLTRDPLGLNVYVLPATRTYEDSVILTHGDITDRRQQFGFGAKTPVLDLIWRLYKGNRFFYHTNSEGALMQAYIRATNMKMRKMQN